MKVTIIGPGFGNIPPNGWGAVEIIIWNLKLYLEKYFQRPKSSLK